MQGLQACATIAVYGPEDPTLSFGNYKHSPQLNHIPAPEVSQAENWLSFCQPGNVSAIIPFQYCVLPMSSNFFLDVHIFHLLYFPSHFCLYFLLGDFSRSLLQLINFVFNLCVCMVVRVFYVWYIFVHVDVCMHLCKCTYGGQS